MPLDFEAFKKLVKSYGFKIEGGSKHRQVVVDENGVYVSSFAITHQKGSKDFIKDPYVRALHKAAQKRQEEQP